MLDSARGITTFESGGSAYAAVASSNDDGVQILRLTGGAPTATLDNPPAVTSIEKSSPAAASTSSRTLVFKVTFGEDVTGVDTGDFALSPDSGFGQFTHTGTPGLAIPDNAAAISDAITVPGPGTVTSVSVSVDIAHPHIGDLVVELVAPDGTARTLHSRSGGLANDIVRTYTSDFAGTGITGDWTLRIRDHATRDTGTLNSWTLHDRPRQHRQPRDRPDRLRRPVPGERLGRAGRDSAAQDGTYNLDIVPNNGITDMAGNPLDGTGPTGEDQLYTVRTPAIQNATTSTPPSINAGPDQTVQGGQVVSLTGTATDVDSDPLTYSWSHDSALAIEFANSTAPSTAFTAPQVSSNTTFILTLTVDDGTQAASDSLSITIVETPESPRDIGEITLTSTGPGVIEASWEAPTETPADYRIAWANVGEPYLTWTDLSGNAFPASPSQTVTDLEEGEQYKVKVRARYSSGGPGDWSGEFTVTVARS